MTRRLAVIAVAVVAVLAGVPASASAERGLTTGFADTILSDQDPLTRALWLDRSVEAEAGLVLFFLSWRGASSGKPADPTDPADPAYSFAGTDAAVTDATARGLDVVISPTYAPDFAEGPGRPANVVPGAWKPDPAAFGDFGEALARRYSGAFTPAGASSPLPRVDYYQAWTEPNLIDHLAPQYAEGGAAFSPGHYRRLLNAFYERVHAVNPSAQVVGAGTAPYGDPDSTASITPLRFWRNVLCLRGRTELRASACPQRAKLDIFAHNAITNPFGPTKPAALADNASTADFGKLRRVIRAAERHGTVGPARSSRPLWSTEMWWDSSPPDHRYGVPLARQARWTQQALYVLWKNGASAAINLQIRDDTTGTFGFADTLQAGLYFRDGRPKPSLQAFRFPFVCERAGAKRTTAWGRSPAAGELVIERRENGGWREVRTLQVDAADVFQERLRLGGPQALRARVGGEVSLTWKQG